ncbi:MAG: glycosyltransferase family 1 protein [Planctomycetota bacterium]|jgi:glycosyltransferase involved in cell wall biosynthesis|nr:glycosyltransferase family 1 protein [Planctomycetota bacterium]
MKIGIDGRCFLVRRTGVGRYVWSMCQALNDALPEAQFVVYGRSDIELPVTSPRWQVRDIYSRRKRFPLNMPRYLLSGRHVANDQVDVFWATNTVVPFGLGNIPVVASVYDLTHVIAPETMDVRNRVLLTALYARSIRRAQECVSISHGTARRLTARYGKPVRWVAHPALDGVFAVPAPHVQQAAMDKHGLSGRYVLCVGTLEPRKRLECAILGYLHAQDRGLAQDWALAIVGGRGWKGSRLEGLVEKGMARGVKMLGFVDDEDLAALYARAAFLFFPSQYEGFGFPVLEAGACGSAVVAADLEEVREAAGPGARMVGPGLRPVVSAFADALSVPPGPAGVPSPMPTWEHSGRVLAAALQAAAR